MSYSVKGFLAHNMNIYARHTNADPTPLLCPLDLTLECVKRDMCVYSSGRDTMLLRGTYA